MFIPMLTTAIFMAAPIQKVAPAPSEQSPTLRVPRQPRPTDSTLGETVVLFNGKDLTGWKPFLPNGEDPKGTWSVKDGVLSCVGMPVGYIRTEKKFRDFELEVEWRFDPEKGAGNSGVLLRVQPPDEVWPKSIEAQLHSGNAGDIWNIGEFPMKPVQARTEGRRTRKEHQSSEKPLGEWNNYRIVLNGGQLKLFVNGVLQNLADGCEPVEGWIGLQSEGAYIEFRKVELRPLRGATATQAID